jgi:ketosteroid isomerase-like protein
MPTNKQIIQGAYEAFAEADVPKVLAAMDDKIEWTEAEGPAPRHIGGAASGRRRRVHATR